MLVHHGANFNHRFDQLMWRDDITQPQRWVQDLAHRARVDNTPHIVQALQTWEWGTGITKFCIVIVLENVGVARARKIDQRGSPRETHRQAERELVRRSYVNYFWRALF